MQWLLLNGSTLEERDYAGNTALHNITRNGHVELLRHLLLRGYRIGIALLCSIDMNRADPQARNYRNQTILDAALLVEDKTRQQTHVVPDPTEHEKYVRELHTRKRSMLVYLIQHVRISRFSLQLLSPLGAHFVHRALRGAGLFAGRLQRVRQRRAYTTRGAGPVSAHRGRGAHSQ